MASWRFRNARNAEKVWDRVKPAPTAFRLPFLNITSGDTVKVTLPEVVVPFVWAENASGDESGSFLPGSLLDLGAGGTFAEARRLLNLAHDASNRAAVAVSSESTPAGSPCIDPLPMFIELRLKWLEERLAAPERRLGELKTLEATSTAATRVTAAQVADEFRAWAREIERILGHAQGGACRSAPDIHTIATAREQLSTFVRENRVRQGGRVDVAVTTALDLLAQAAAAVAESIRMSPPASQAGAAQGSSSRDRAQQIFGVQFSDCRRSNGEVMCVPTLTLAPNAQGWVSGLLLVKYPPRTLIRFRVSFPFALESDQPANQFGYFKIDEDAAPPPSSVLWTASGTLVSAREPFYGPAGTVIEPDDTYEGTRTRQLRATARTSLSYALSDRASGTIEFQFKDGILGRDQEDLDAKVNQYSFQVFGFRGTSLKFGKYLFAKPTDGLAIAELGEGVTGRYKWFGLSHLIRREGVKGAADPDDDDHKVWLFDAINIPVRGWTFLRSLNFYALHGIDDTPDRQRRYSTAGGEMLLGIPSQFATGTFAYYRSWTRPDAGSPMRRGDGSAWLVRGSKSWFDQNKPARTAALTIAKGSGDRPGSDDRFEGYLGETASYTPDGSHFLSTLAPRLRLEPVPFFIIDKATGAPALDKDGKPIVEFASRGLSNRHFVGAALSDQTFSPLEIVAFLMGVPERDVKSRQSTLRVHYYSPAEQFLGTRTGTWETQVEFQLESPEGAKYSLKLTRTFPRGPLEPLFPSEPWSIVGTCIVTLK